jgi:hypothetical protein
MKQPDKYERIQTCESCAHFYISEARPRGGKICIGWCRIANEVTHQKRIACTLYEPGDEAPGQEDEHAEQPANSQ